MRITMGCLKFFCSVSAVLCFFPAVHAEETAAESKVPEERRIELIRECMDNIHLIQRYLENARRIGSVYPSSIYEITQIPFCELLKEVPVCPVCGMEYLYTTEKSIANPQYTISCPCPEASWSGKHCRKAAHESKSSASFRGRKGGKRT